MVRVFFAFVVYLSMAVTLWACIIAAAVGEGWYVGLAVFLFVVSVCVFVAMIEEIE